MNEIEVKRYSPDRTAEWDLFVKEAKQSTFLLERAYMDYHKDRFNDHSLMIYVGGKLYALLPANQVNDVLWSHQGLTYGGLLTGRKASTTGVRDVFIAINQYLKAIGFKKVIYKAIPWFYHQLPAEEDLYSIFNSCNGRLIERNVSTLVLPMIAPNWKYDRRYGAKKALSQGVVIQREDEGLKDFWQILEQNLMISHGVRPVHTFEEISYLHDLFPKNIQLYTARINNEILGGCLLYVNKQVVHSQYISASTEGKHLGVLDALFQKLLKEDLINYRYFDFGTSNEDHGRYLNEGLIYQKEGFGGRAVCYDVYEWDLV